MLEQYGNLNIVSNVSNLQVLVSMVENSNVATVGYYVDNLNKMNLRFVPIQGNLRHTLMICYNKDLPSNYIETLKDMALYVIK